MSYLAIDLWDKRCWIAISQQSIAFAKDIVQRVSLVDYLKKMILTQPEISHIVVWLPYDLYGNDTRQLDRTQKFMSKLEKIFPEKIVVWHDERFSSFQAQQWFDDHRDDVAAQCILQSYLDSEGSNIL